ncbi:retrovirus-related pol polyprotein from transposon TNT 1-94 [Tanacetum coccineum]
MITLAEFMIIAGADNRPPMLEKSLYDSWKSRMEHYLENRENGRMILNSVQNGPLICPTITEENGTIRTKNVSLTFSEAGVLHVNWTSFGHCVSRRGLPPDVYAIVNHHKVAKEIWGRVKLLMQGTKLSLQEKECKLYDEFDKFTFVKGLVVPVFNQGNDLIACLNKATAFRTAVASSSYKGNATSLGGNNTGGQARVVNCYNCQGEGHMARQYTQPKRHRNVAWFKENEMLAEAQEAGQILDEEKLAFLVDPVLMANLSSYGSDILLEVPHSETSHNDMDNEITSDSNIIPYSQYLQETQLEAVQDTNFPVFDDEETLILEEVSRSKMLAKQNDPISKEKKVKTTPINYAELYRLYEDLNSTTVFDDVNVEMRIYFENNDLKAQLQAKDTTICKLKEHIKSMRENVKEEKVKHEMDKIETINIELEHSVAKLLSKNEHLHIEIEHLKNIYKDQFDSIKKIRALSKKHSDSLIGQLNSKSMENADLKHQIQDKGIVKQAKAKQPLGNVLDFACKHAKRIQELLVYVRDTCPNAFKPSENMIDVTPMDKIKKVRIEVFLRSKDEAPKAIIKCIKNIQVRLNATVRNVRTDNGTKFNGVVERRNRTLVEVARTMLIFSKAPLFLWAEAINTACYTQNRSLIRLRYNKTPYELMHDKKPDLSFLHVFSSLCYPTNDSEDLGKLNAKADIGIFVGYAPAKKAFRIYNRRTQKIMETILVTLDELTTMASEQFGSGPGLQSMTPATISSGLIPNPIPQQPFLVVAEPRDVDIAESPVTSIQSTQEREHSPIISQAFEESPKIPHFHDDPLHESLHEDSTYQGSSSNVRLTYTLFEHLGRWTKDHPIANVIGDPSHSVTTRKQLETDVMWCYFDAFLTSVEPKNFKQAMIKPSWINAMQE